MRSVRLGLALVPLLWWAVALDAHAQSENATGEVPPADDAPPMPCPLIDSLSPTSPHVFDFPPEQTSLYAAEYEAHDGTRHPGQFGVDLIADLIVRSMRPGCTPVRLALIMGAADYDSRGKGFEDTMSIQRWATARLELVKAFETLRRPLIERGEIPDLEVIFTGGGIGTRAATPNPADEAARRKNRWVRVRLVQVIPGPQTETETAAPPVPVDPEVIVP